jgi:hypothetical protein
MANDGSQDLVQTETSDALAWNSASGLMGRQTSPDAPAVVEYGNEFIMAYVASKGSHIVVSTSKDGVTWTKGTVVKNQYTNSTPALADYAGQLVMAYRAADAGDDVVVTTTTTPLAWSDNGYWMPQQAGWAAPSQTPSTPALAVYKGKLIMAVQLNNGTDDIAVSATTNPDDWGTDGSLVKDQTTRTSPSLSEFDNKLVLAYIAQSAGSDIVVTTTTTPLAWSDNGYFMPQQAGWPAPSQSLSAPSTFKYNGELVMAVRLPTDGNDIAVSVTSNPDDWGTVGGTLVPDQQTPATPVLF